MKLKRAVLTAFAVFTLPLFAGGFYLNVKPASAVPEAHAGPAALVAMLSGCHQAEKGRLTATAEGLVKGKRQTLPLKVTVLDKPGWFAVEKQWPDSGRWVVVLSATHPAFPVATTTAVPIIENAPQFSQAKYENRRPLEKAEVEALLR